MSKIAIIGGTGLTSLKNLKIIKREMVQTPYGDPSAPLTHGELDGHEMVFLPRHGAGHTIPPHKINYRANIWALKDLGVEHILAVAAVGGISKEMTPTHLVIPDQIIDYTWSRINTFFEEGLSQVVHVDFTHPYDDTLRQALIASCRELGLGASERGTYAATQGPRLETAAEIDRLERDGCHIVGMTGMPEAALAREQGLNYACLAVVANAAAGRSDEALTMEAIEKYLSQGMDNVREVLGRTISRL